MRKAVLGVVAAVFAWTVGAQVVTWPAAEGTTATDGEYRVTVNGRPVDVLYIPKPSMHDGQLTGDENLQPYYAALFDADEEVTVAVESPKDLSGTRVLPTSRGIRPTVESAHRVTFRAKPPFKLSFEPRPRHRALVLSAHLPEKDAPAPGTPGVRYFGPGRHHFDKVIRLESNETLYLAPGAWVESAVYGEGTNITVRGRGVLSGLCWDWGKGPAGDCRMLVFCGQDIRLRDVTVIGAWSWCVVLDGCTRALVDGVSILNGHVLNDDGIDVCNCRDVTVRNVFIRSQDDCVTPKYSLDGFRVENVVLWTDVANIFRIGYECHGPSRRFANFRVKGVDVLHQSVHKPPTGALWSENAVYIQASNDMTFEDMVFEDFRFDGSEPGDNLVNVRTQITSDEWQQHKLPGRVRNVTFRNFRFPGGLPEQSQAVYLESLDDAHTVEGVRFEDFDPRLAFVTKGKVGYEKTHVKPIPAEPVKVIFDTDMYTDFDDVGALACLHALQDAGECEILATVVNTRECLSVAMCEIVNAYYGRPDIPVGCVRGIGIAGDKDGYNAMRFGSTVKKYRQWVRHENSSLAPDAAEVYRQVLQAQPDKSVVICSVGFLTNMRKLVESDRNLVARKVRLWVAMACKYPRGSEYNSSLDRESSKIALEKWPTPIVFSDFDYGVDCYAGRKIAESDVQGSPVADVFRANAGDFNGAAGRSAWDETAVLAAVRGVDRYFNVHRGTYRMVGADGENEWIEDEKHGPHIRIAERLKKVEVGKVIDELICRGPDKGKQRGPGLSKEN